MAISALSPFQIDPPLRDFCDLHPEAERLREILRLASRAGRETLVRLWLTEGCPVAFLRCPAVYDAVRVWLGSQLGVHSKSITLLGSGRFGFSLRPPPVYGRAFNLSSDLDLSAVSSDLFNTLVELFQLFHEDYRIETITPRNGERAYWPENVKVGNANIAQGFIDVNKIPWRSRYLRAKQMGNTLWLLTEKLATTPNAPRPKRATLRVYRDWDALVMQVSRNLHNLSTRLTRTA